MKRFKLPVLVGVLFAVVYSVNYKEISNASSISDIEQIVANRLIPNTVDIRGRGMGKLGVALARGNAIFINPAVAASLDKTMVAGGGRVHFGMVDDEYSQNNSDGYTAMYKPHVKLTHLSGVVPFKLAEFPISIGAGAGYHTVYDFGENYYFSKNDGDIDKTLKIHGGLNLLSPSFSLGFFDKIYAGITVNMSVLGTVSAEEKEDGELSDPEEFDGSGTYAILGILAKPVDPLSIGLSYWPGFEWKFGGGDYVAIPPMLVCGANYQISEQIMAGLEFQTRLYKKLTTREEGPMGNGFALRAGGEYDFGPVALRLGGFGETVPIGDYNYNRNTESDDPTFAFGATGGAGIRINKVTIDLGLSWTHYAQEMVDSVNATTLETYTYSENHFRFDAGVAIDLPGIGFEKRDELEPVIQDTIMPEPIPEPERRKPVY
ncbi:MAG: hypothetical protein GF401_01125 [Chitinivibrionales bacterium]|nr:hypothetical protein [Chitinivibrionales bacterium]